MKVEFCKYGGSYFADENGFVFGKNGNKLKQRPDKDGYPSVTLGDKKHRSKVRVHRIIAELFVDNLENKPEVNHIDGVKTNNSYTNLEWMTRSEQMFHSYKIGLRKKRVKKEFILRKKIF